MSCVQLKKKELWDNSFNSPTPANVNGFFAVDIMSEGLSSEVWFTENENCIVVQDNANLVYKGQKSIYLKWDKKEGNCDWIGLGIGWDGWAGKDLGSIINNAAIEIKVRKPEGKVKSLPLAAALEDYGGSQAWLGFLPEYIEHKKGEDWATVTLPLQAFSWQEFGADYSNVKQLIIQFEASGEAYFDEIRIVPYTKIGKKRYLMTAFGNEPSVKLDGNPSEAVWNKTTSVQIGSNKVALIKGNEYLYLSGTISDSSPLQNGKANEGIWNGDAVELAFSTNTEVNAKRKSYMYSDQHIGLKMNANPMVWDWRRKQAVAEAEVKVAKSESGYTFEAKIPLRYFDAPDFVLNQVYGMEIAINQGTNAKRENQIRWNSNNVEGFNTNPSLWGELIIVNENHVD